MNFLEIFFYTNVAPHLGMFVYFCACSITRGRLRWIIKWTWISGTGDHCGQSFRLIIREIYLGLCPLDAITFLHYVIQLSLKIFIFQNSISSDIKKATLALLWLIFSFYRFDHIFFHLTYIFMLIPSFIRISVVICFPMSRQMPVMRIGWNYLFIIWLAV